MRLLLLGVTGAEPSYLAWRTSLERAGIPYQAAALAMDDPPLALRDSAQIRGAGHAPFQAVIFATAGAVTVLGPDERRGLEALEREVGVRRLVAYAEPGPEFGLAPAGWEGPLEELGVRLTPDGLHLFPYLRGPLPVDPGSWCYPASPLPRAAF